MKRFLSLLLLCLCVSQLNAQLTRYKDEIFGGVRVTKDIKYGSNIPYASNDPVDLYLDLYEPAGDTLSTPRPLIILAHGGSFLPLANQPRSPLGTKYDYPIVELAQRFAAMGYVVASIDYRLGWNPAADAEDVRRAGIIQAAYRGIQDGKAVVRFFNKNASQYKIDPAQIAFAGSQAGGYIPLHMVFLDKDAELQMPKFKVNGVSVIDKTKLGDFEGESGNPGFPSTFKLAISLGAALADSSIVEGGEPTTIIAMHGTSDQVTPYGTDLVIPAATGKPVIEVSGGRDLVAVANRVNASKQAVLSGITNTDLPGADKGYFQANGQPLQTRTINGLYSFWGADFQPYAWYDGDNASLVAKGKVYCDTVVDYLNPRLFKVLDLPTITYTEKVTGLAPEMLQAPLQVFPNPANDRMNILVGDSKAVIENVKLVDLTGRSVAEYKGAGSNLLEINALNLVPGVYFVKISTNKGLGFQKVVVE